VTRGSTGLFGFRFAGIVTAGAWALAAAPAVAAEPAPAGASSCSGCHAPGASVGDLAGRPAETIAAALAAYREGQRPGTVMPRIAKGFSETESRALADWFAGQGR
jgi:cytochrome c553